MSMPSARVPTTTAPSIAGTADDGLDTQPVKRSPASASLSADAGGDGVRHALGLIARALLVDHGLLMQQTPPGPTKRP